MVVNSQSISLISNANTFDQGIFDIYGDYNNRLYLQHNTSGGQSILARYDGNSIKIAAKKDSLYSYPGLQGSPILFNGYLFLRYSRFGRNVLYRFSDSDTSFLAIANPDQGYGYMGNPLIYNNKLIIVYKNAAYANQLAVYNGSNLIQIPNPDAGEGVATGYDPIIYQGKYYFTYKTQNNQHKLAVYDGTAVSLVNSGGVDVATKPIIYQGKLCINNGIEITTYNGTTVTRIPTPPNFSFRGNGLEYKNSLWFFASTFYQGPKFQLAKFDGNSISLVGSLKNRDFGFYEKIIYNDTVYFKCDSTTIYSKLGKFDGASIDTLSNPNPSDFGIYSGIKVSDSLMFFTYKAVNNRNHIAVSDGKQVTVIPHPPGGYESGIKTFAFNGELFTTYNTNGKGNLAKISSVSRTPLCPGNNVTFNASLSGNSYQWQVNNGSGFINLNDNATYAGTNSSSLQVVNVSTQFYSNRYRCIVDGLSSILYSFRFINGWNGSVNFQWENPANWSCGIVPDTHTDVVINSGNVVISSNVTIRSLIINAQASLTVAPGVTLTILH